MLNAIITHNGNTLLLEFPCKRMLLAEHLASIGIRTQPSDIKCIDEEDAPIQVKIYGESEFDSKLASLVSPENSIQGVNGWCDIYHNLPYANKQKIQSAVLNGEVNSLKEFGELLINQHTNNVTEHFYCPLVATVYFRDKYGNCDDFPNEYEGDFLFPYECKCLIYQTYTDVPPKRLPLSQENAFKPIRNAVIKRAAELSFGPADDEPIPQENTHTSDTSTTTSGTSSGSSTTSSTSTHTSSSTQPTSNQYKPQILTKVTRLGKDIADTFRDRYQEMVDNPAITVDSKLKREIEAKKKGQRLSM